MKYRNKHGLHIVRYRTARECIAAFHGCRVSELPKAGRWTFFDRQGKARRLSVKACYKEMQRRGCWGWVRSKRTLHLWVSSRAKLSEVVALLAHEIGHCERPFLSRGKEEQKAARYEYVAQSAIEMLTKLRRMRKCV